MLMVPNRPIRYHGKLHSCRRWLEEDKGRLITEGGVTDSGGTTALFKRAYQRMAVPPFVYGLLYIGVVAIWYNSLKTSQTISCTTTLPTMTPCSLCALRYPKYAACRGLETILLVGFVSYWEGRLGGKMSDYFWGDL